MRLLVVSAVTLACLTPAFAADTVQFRADAQHTGVYSSASLSGNPHIRWRFKTGNKVRSTPAIYEGLVIFGSNDGSVYAVEESGGKQRWVFPTGGPVSSSPAVAEGVAYIQSGEGKVYALDAKTGKQRWSFAVGSNLPGPKEFRQWDFYLSSPAIAEGKVFVGAGDGKFYALDAATGKQLWSFATTGRIRSTAAVHAGVVYFGSMDGNLYALNAATGKQNWKFKTAGSQYFPLGEVQSSPVVADGGVYFGSRDGNLYALDAANGAVRWKFSHDGSWVIGSPALAKGVLYVGSSDARFVQAVDAKTGKENWHQKTNDNVFSSAAVIGNQVVFADWNGAIAWRDITTGKTVSGLLVEDRINSSPVVHEGTVFFGCDDDYLYAVEARPEASMAGR